MLSPVNKETNPPLFGRLAASSDKDLAALADAVTASGLIPVMESAYAFIPAPNGANWWPKEERLFSPVNKATRPPLFGRFAANSDNDLAALADAVTASTSIPEIESA